MGSLSEGGEKIAYGRKEWMKGVKRVEARRKRIFQRGLGGKGSNEREAEN